MVFEGVAQNIGSWWASVNAPVGSAPSMTTDEYAQSAPLAGTSASDIVTSAGERVSDFAASANNVIESANEPVQPMSQEQYGAAMPLSGSNPLSDIGSGIGSWWSDVSKPGNQPDDLGQGSASAVETSSAASAAPSNDFFGSIGKWWGDQSKPGNQPDDLAGVSEGVNIIGANIVAGGGTTVNKISTGNDILDTSTPASQKYSLDIVPTVQQINRADYTKTQDLGDSKTQDLIQKQGYSPEQALAMQADAAKEAHNGRAERYYRNELDKALENNITLSSAYHSDAMKSGLPQRPNPFEYAGDLSLSTLYKSQGVSNESGSRGLPQYGGSLLKEANIITKAERTFDTGPYNTTNLQSYSPAYGVLSLSMQQAIGAQAAKTATERGAGWNINPDTMKKYTPELIQGSGFALKYKEAADTLNPADYALQAKRFEQPTIFDHKDAHVEDIFNKGGGDQMFGVVNFGKTNENAIDLTKVPGGTKSWTDNKLSDTTGGILGSGETLGGFTLQSIGVTPLKSRGTAMAGVYRKSAFAYPFLKRRHIQQYKKKSITHITTPKQNPKIFNLESLNKQVMPKTLGSELFKFKIGASDKVMKPMNARNISSGSKINSISDNFKLDNVGVNLSKGKSVVTGNANMGINLSKTKSAVLGTMKPSKNKSIIGNINLDNIGINLPKSKSKSAGVNNTGINLPKNKSSVSGNIKNVMDDAVRSIKVKSMVK